MIYVRPAEGDGLVRISWDTGGQQRAGGEALDRKPSGTFWRHLLLVELQEQVQAGNLYGTNFCVKRGVEI